MPNWKSRSDTEAWWSSQPGNRGKTYPGDDIAEKQYQRNKAAGENNLSILRNLFKRRKEEPVDLGPSASPDYDYPTKDGAVTFERIRASRWPAPDPVAIGPTQENPTGTEKVLSFSRVRGMIRAWLS